MSFADRRQALLDRHQQFLAQPNPPVDDDFGLWTRRERPILSAAHAPITWRYDLAEDTNPALLERMGINAAFNAGAIYHDGQFTVCVRVEGDDRKSFFALADSADGVEGWRFRAKPVWIEPNDPAETNHYDMRLTAHADGWIYGLFCVERHDDSTDDLSAAIAQCGIVRTKDLETFERLPDLQTPSAQQRNVVLHPEYVDGKYMLYTRPQQGFISVGAGGGIGYGFVDDMTRAVIDEELILDPRAYHTVKELKNGQGPAPLKTDIGWIHCAHGVRNTAAGLRYTLYAFVTALDDPTRVTHRPMGHLLAPRRDERVGDVSNVAFANGWIEHEGTVYLYYGASDTRLHVATTPLEHLVDFCLNTPEDTGTTHGNNRLRLELIERNEGVLSLST